MASKFPRLHLSSTLQLKMVFQVTQINLKMTSSEAIQAALIHRSTKMNHRTTKETMELRETSRAAQIQPPMALIGSTHPFAAQNRKLLLVTGSNQNNNTKKSLKLLFKSTSSKTNKEAYKRFKSRRNHFTTSLIETTTKQRFHQIYPKLSSESSRVRQRESSQCIIQINFSLARRM